LRRDDQSKRMQIAKNVNMILVDKEQLRTDGIWA
jgi:hypothetical protein